MQVAGRITVSSAAAVSALLQQLQGQDKDVRLAAVTALGLINAQPELFSNDKEPKELRSEAAAALARIGPKAKSAVPILLVVVARDEESSSLRAAAIQALEKIGVEPRKIIPLLINIVDDEMLDNPTSGGINNDLSSGALLFLARLVGPESKETIPILTRALKQYVSNPRYSHLIAEALGKMGPAARAALPILREAAKSTDRQLWLSASKAIERIKGE